VSTGILCKAAYYVDGYMDISGSIDFNDPQVITYSAATLTESLANNGTISTTLTLTLSGDTFTAGPFTSGVEYTVTNTPAGLTGVVTRTSATTATLTLTGTAGAHANAQDIANLTVTFANATFTGNNASLVANSTKADLVVDFADQASIAYSGSFSETGANDGTVTGSILAVVTGDTFAATIGVPAQVVVTNLPAGLTAVATRISATVVEITLTGTAGAHANLNDVANLTIAFQNGAFTNTTLASNVTSNTYATGAVNFNDPSAGALAYSATTFAENAANDGTIVTAITATLTPATTETFTNPSGNLTIGTHYTVTNLPTGLTLGTIAINGTGLIATITLSGIAAAHANANDITNLNIAFLPSAFTNATVPASGSQVYSIDFLDPGPALGYSAATLTESLANNGTISTTLTLTLSGDTFTAGPFTSGVEYTVTNTPAGLTGVVTRTSATTATLTLTGTAGAHANAQDIANLTVTFANAAFTGNNASLVANSTKADLVVDFADQASIAYSGSFSETGANTGALAGSRTATLTGDTYVATLTEGVHYTLTNKPAGLTAVMTRTSPTVATLTFTGTATVHTNAADVLNLTVTWLDGAFTNTTLAANVTGNTDATGAIDFADPASIAYSGSFSETGTNTGAVSGSILAVVTGDTFAATIGVPAQVVVTNLPAGLTAVATRISASVVQITLTGTATTHANAQDIANLTIAFQNSAFVDNTSASNVTGNTYASGVVDFNDPTSSPFLNYATATFNEAAVNNGTITDTIALTLSGDTFTSASGVLSNGVDYTVTNLPAGLTMVITRTSTTTATISITGTAGAHANLNDVANLTIVFANSAFTGGAASGVTNYNKSDLVVNFNDPAIGAALVYDVTTLVEAVANNGSITTTATGTLTGDTFVAGPFVANTHYVAANVPAGLTASVTRTSATTVTVTLTGTATVHANANDVSNVLITFLNGAFTGNTASNVAGAGQTFTVDFTDAVVGKTLSYVGLFQEAVTNNGTIKTGGVAGSQVTFTLTNDTFTSVGAQTVGVHYTASNVPAGLTMVVTTTSTTAGTITLTGTAGAHATANDVANLTIAWANAAFTGNDASTITGNTNNTMVINYSDPAGATADVDLDSINDADEDAAVGGTGDIDANATADASESNVAGTSNTSTATAGDSIGVAATGVCTTITDLDSITEPTGGNQDTTRQYPLGLVSFVLQCTAAGSSATVTVYFEGPAGVNYTPVKYMGGSTYVSIPGAVITTVARPGGINLYAVTYTVTDGGSLDYDGLANGIIVDPIGLAAPTISYSGTFSESGSNNGAVTGSRTASISGDTFTAGVANGAVFTPTTHYTVANVPAGLTAVMTKTSATVATLTLTGNTTTHANANDVANLTITWQDGAFANTTTANAVTGYTDATGVIDFSNPSSSGGGGGGGGGGAPSSVTCNTGEIFSPLNGKKCTKWTGAPTVVTCITGQVFSPTSGQKCTAWTGAATTNTTTTAVSNSQACSINLVVNNPVRFKSTVNSPEDIKIVQQFLNEYEGANLPVDGIYSQAMLLKVIAWQEKYAAQVLTPWGLKYGTGYIFTASIAQMKRQQQARCAVQPVVSTPVQTTVPTTSVVTTPVTTGGVCFNQDLKSPSNGKAVSDLQAFLAEQGFMSTVGNGNYGPATIEAVKRFQSAYPDTYRSGGLTKPTGWFYSSTRAQANKITGCTQ
jgi:hypothetical protein